MDKNERSESLELAKADRIELTLPPKAVTVIEIRQIRRLDEIFARADLAIATREVNLKANVVTGVVHNIGSANVADAVVAVVNPAGKRLAFKSLGPLPAPLDLVPRRAPFTLELPQDRPAGCKLVLDPDGQVPEISESNNIVAIDDLSATDYSKGWD